MMCKENNIFKKFSYFLTIFIVVLFSTNCYGAVEILNVRHWTAPDHTRIVLDVDGEPDYEVKESENLLILNFNETILL